MAEIPTPPMEESNNHETSSLLNPEFDNEVVKYEGIYKVETPQEVLDICREFNNLGGRALLVGGSVRDTVLSAEHEQFNLEPKDFDIEVYGIPPEKIRQTLEKKYKNVDKVGEQFEVLKVSVEGFAEPFDVSIPRWESKTGKGHAGFEIRGDPEMSIAEATMRRDLTINSLAYDPFTETLYDGYNGVEHIKAGLIEITNEKAFQEDPIRVLRVMKFAGRYDFEVSARTIVLCKEMVERGDLDELAFKPVENEMRDLLIKGRKPSKGLEFAREAGITKKHWPELHALVGTEQSKKWHPEGDAWRHTLQVVDAAVLIADREKLDDTDRLVLTLAAVGHDLGKPLTSNQQGEGEITSYGHEEAGIAPARALFERLFKPEKMKMTPDVIRQVLPLVAEHMRPSEFWKTSVREGKDMSSAMRRLAFRLANGDGHKGDPKYPDCGGTNLYMLSLLKEADQRGRNPDLTTMEPLEREDLPRIAEWQSWFDEVANKLSIKEQAPESLIKGEDLLNALDEKVGGVWLGCILKAVLQDELDGTLSNKKDAIAKGIDYTRQLRPIVSGLSEEQGREEYDIWVEIKSSDDPREYLTASTS